MKQPHVILRPVNEPIPVQVDTNADGTPAAVRWKGLRLEVEAVLDRWRIDEEWWRDEISRTYYALALAGGRRLTVFHDDIKGDWYAQRYSAAGR